jgi:hypothetical protein
MENEDQIVIVKPSMIGEWLSVGEKITVIFPIEKTHVFGYPDDGLKEAISVE